MAVLAQKLEWKDEYSVGVAGIDNQHQLLFKTINKLIDILGNNPTEKEMGEILASIVEYKKIHFATEEGYFKEFNFEGAEEHIKEHRGFSERVAEIQKKHEGDTLNFAFELIDYLEDWLIGHLMNTDQKYVECFKSHGLK